MKDFFKYMFASMAGIILLIAITGVLGVMSIVGMVASGEATQDVSDNTVMVVKLDGTMQERAEEDVMGELMGQVSQNMGLDDMLSAIDKAKKNDKIKGIYLEAGMFAPDSWASMQALRNKLADFRKSGKWIVSYGDTYTQGAYYVASVADKVWLNPQGMIDWHGLAAQPMFLKDLMAKFGVKMQLAKVGAYKSAPEMFVADRMSDANREQVSAYINGIWQQVCRDVSASRRISVEKLNAEADSFAMFKGAEAMVKAGMADKLLYTDQVKQEIKKMMKLNEDDDINTISMAMMKNVKREPNQGDEIAVYYACGDIVDREVQGLAQGGSVIGGDKVCRDLQALADDDDVKAVVLRINSGGGSAYASEQIWHSVMTLREKKPVVVSMGGMAASGGYYISCAANWIVCEPTTLTGSIGIFGMFPDFSGLLTDKLGVKFDEVKTNRNSAFGTMARPFSDEEMAMLNTYIDRGYMLFRKRVADGRKMPVEAVESVAQGRVWLGKDAKGIKLVDELGGMDAALNKAAQLAKMKEWHAQSYPAKASWIDQLTRNASGGSYIDNQLRLSLGSLYEPVMLMRRINEHNAIQARMMFWNVE